MEIEDRGALGWKSGPFSEENVGAFVHAEDFVRRGFEGRDEAGCTGSPHCATSIYERLFVLKSGVG
jgi:hypothetical protein